MLKSSLFLGLTLVLAGVSVAAPVPEPYPNDWTPQLITYQKRDFAGTASTVAGTAVALPVYAVTKGAEVVGNGAAGAAKAVGRGVSNVAHGVANGVSSAVGGVRHGIGGVFEKFGSWVHGH